MPKRSWFSRCGLLVGLLALPYALATGCGGGSGNSGTVNSPRILVAPTHFVTIDGPGGGATTVNGMNNSLTLVGFTSTGGVNANFLRNATGAFTPLTFGDPAAMANGVNASGTVVGGADGHAFQLLNGVLQTITPPGSSSSVAFGVNDLGTVVGQSVAPTLGTTPGFSLTRGQFGTVSPPPGALATVVNAQGVNNSGAVVGFFSTDGTHQHGFLQYLTTLITVVLPDPSTPRLATDPLVLTQFLAVNNNSVAVGYYQTQSGSQFGFMFDLVQQKYLFLDAPLAAPVDGVQITQITGIDDSDDICGFFIDAAGVQHGFLATMQ